MTKKIFIIITSRSSYSKFKSILDGLKKKKISFEIFGIAFNNPSLRFKIISGEVVSSTDIRSFLFDISYFLLSILNSSSSLKTDTSDFASNIFEAKSSTSILNSRVRRCCKLCNSNFKVFFFSFF